MFVRFRLWLSLLGCLLALCLPARAWSASLEGDLTEEQEESEREQAGDDICWQRAVAGRARSRRETRAVAAPPQRGLDGCGAPALCSGIRRPAQAWLRPRGRHGRPEILLYRRGIPAVPDDAP